MHVVILRVIAIDHLGLIGMRMGLLRPERGIDSLDAHHLRPDLRPAGHDHLRARTGLVPRRRSAGTRVHGAVANGAALDEAPALRAARAGLFVAVVVAVAAAAVIG